MCMRKARTTPIKMAVETRKDSPVEKGRVRSILLGARSKEEGVNSGRSGLGGMKQSDLERSVRIGRLFLSFSRLTSSDLAPVLLIAPISLLLNLTRLLLEPLYNTLPLQLHPMPLYTVYTIVPVLVYWRSTIHRSARDAICARVCLCISAGGGDLVAIGGRRVGSLTGRILGAEWGAWAALMMLGVVAVGGGVGFALLCFVRIPQLGIFRSTSSMSRTDLVGLCCPH